MIVQIGNKIYDAAIEPIMLVFTPQDKRNIASMPRWATRYCAAPDTMSDVEMKKFMRSVLPPPSHGRRQPTIVSARNSKPHVTKGNTHGKT